MGKKIFILFLVSIFILPLLAWAERQEGKAFHEQQKVKKQEHMQMQHKENKEFRQTLKEKTPEEKAAMVKEHRQVQFKENKAFGAQRHQENMSFLKERLANNKKLTDAQKNELTSFFESQYQENAAFRDQRHSENVAFFEKISNDSSMTQEQKKAAIKSHIDEQKAQAKAHMEEQKAQGKAERKKIHSEVKAQAQGQAATENTSSEAK